MKKTLLVLSALVALSMAFVGCKKSNDDATSLDTSKYIAINEAAFEGAWSGGLKVAFDAPVDMSKYSKIKVDADCIDASNNVIEPTYGLGQVLVVIDLDGSWSAPNMVKCQYNLTMQDVDVSDVSETCAGIIIQSSSNDVKYIGVKSISFE